MFKVPEKNRVAGQKGQNSGIFVFTTKDKWVLACVVSDGEGWEHVSVHACKNRKNGALSRIPTWYEMNVIKDIFWEEDDCVVQFHPPKKDYVNCHPHVLHLWRKVGEEFPRPASHLVGLKTGRDDERTAIR